MPFAPGGSTDTTGRLIAEKLRPILGQTVVVDNRGGAGGNIGANLVAKSAPDGYTLLMAINAHAAAGALYKKLQYQFLGDLKPAAQIVSFPNVLVVRKDFPVKTLAEMVTYIREKKGALNYGSAGNGSSQHLSTALFNKMLNGDMVHVPFKGGALANAALLSGDVQVVIASFVEVQPYLKAGTLRALGVTSKERLSLLADVPAINEALPGYDVVLWNGIMVPAGTPEPIVNRINAAVRKVLADPEFKKSLAAQGYTTFDVAPAELQRIYQTETEKWHRMVAVSGAHVE